MLIAAAMFYEPEDLERAVQKLKAVGIREKHISIVRQSNDGPVFVNGTGQEQAMGHGVGTLARALARWGIEAKCAGYVSDEVHQGGFFLAVDLADESLRGAAVQSIFHEFNGRLTVTAA